MLIVYTESVLCVDLVLSEAIEVAVVRVANTKHISMTSHAGVKQHQNACAHVGSPLMVSERSRMNYLR
ncbi:unnamed protein product [Arctia plantaginis]|uniref:Uncharacterized protein n=1 Tax=Arctia plantaginis TaxID=874455 RepID=A0A8S1BJ45_ARCPL|nr:unnamed protein product [Arctia plantaginis]